MRWRNAGLPPVNTSLVDSEINENKGSKEGMEGMIVSTSAVHRLAGIEDYLHRATVRDDTNGSDGAVVCLPDVHATLILSVLHLLAEPFGDPNPLHAPAAEGKQIPPSQHINPPTHIHIHTHTHIISYTPFP